MLDKVCNGNVVVVGNGPLCDEDREDINSGKYDCIVRFNDRKNLKDGEKTTVHAVRDVPKWFGVRSYPGVTNNEQVWLQPVTARPKTVKKLIQKDYANGLLPALYVHEENSQVFSSHLFPGCAECKTKFECETSASKYGPSTGAVILDALQSSPHVDQIHVYGMNWNGNEQHLDFRQPDLVPECCTKCVIHQTASGQYI